MTIQVENRFLTFLGNGSTTTFAFTFKVFQGGDVKVCKLTPTNFNVLSPTEYTVTLNPNQNTSPGGSVTINTAPLSGETVILTSKIQKLQMLDLNSQQAFFPEQLEDAYDKLTAELQQLQSEVDRCIKLSIPKYSKTTEVPYSSQSLAGKALMFDANENITTAILSTSGTTADVFPTLAQGTGAGLIGFQRSAANSILTNLAAWLNGTPFNVVDDFGADKTGATSATTAFQNAINAASVVVGRGRSIFIPAGVYKQTATLTVPSSAQGISFHGEGQTRTMIYRSTDYGTTILLGSSSDAAIESTLFENIFFYHDYGGYENGMSPSTLVNKPTTGSHIDSWNPIRLQIRNCNLWNMVTNIKIRGGSDIDIESCSLRGSWDHVNTQTQVTTESISLIQAGAAQAYAVPTNVRITNNNMVGYLSPLRSVTYGSYTANISENIGPLTGVRISAGEVIQITGGAIGGHNDTAVTISPSVGVPLLNVFINSVFFDGSRLAAIRATNGGTACAAYNVKIDDCTFIGQNNSDNAIWIGNAEADTTPSVSGIDITNNTFVAYNKNPLNIYNAIGIKINNNNIRWYNSVNGFIDNFNACAIYLGKARVFSVSDNTIGGGNLYEPFVPSAASACYYGINISTNADIGTIHDNVIGSTLVQTPILDNSPAAADITIKNNLGFNSVDYYVASPPAVPASTVDLKNPYHRDMIIYIYGGTITTVKISGITAGISPLGPYYLPAGKTISITYSSVPSWIWIGA